MTAGRGRGEPRTGLDGNPFVDQRRVREEFYASPGRVARRSQTLRDARTAGRDVLSAIVDLTAQHRPLAPDRSGDTWPRVIADVGCGRGSSSLTLAHAFPAARVLMLDLSAALLAEARARAAGADAACTPVRGDFHALPLASGSCDLVVAAFCLYHSLDPTVVLREIARCLDDDGVAILVTKSEASYRELDEMVTGAGLDVLAGQRPSLYSSAHSDNLAALTRRVLEVRAVVHDPQTFTFPDLATVAGYLATSPKYHLPPELAGDASAITAALRLRFADRAVTATSTVTFVVAGRGRERA